MALLYNVKLSLFSFFCYSCLVLAVIANPNMKPDLLFLMTQVVVTECLYHMKVNVAFCSLLYCCE